MAKRRWPTDYRLWALAAGVVFIPLGFMDLLAGSGKEEHSLWAYLRLLLAGGHNNQALVSMLVIQGLFLAIPAAAIGWLVQALAVMCGVRLTGRPDRQMVRDYQEPKAAAADHAAVGPVQANTFRGRPGG